MLKDALIDGSLMEMTSYTYNMDETGMPLRSQTTQLKRIAPKRFMVRPQEITIISCTSVTGTVLPPMVIFKGKRLKHEWTRGESLVKYMECH